MVKVERVHLCRVTDDKHCVIRYDRRRSVALRWVSAKNCTHHLTLLSYVLSLSHSRSGVGGAGHRPNPFQVAPEASWVGSEGVSWPGVPPGVIVSRTLEHQMLDRLVGAVAVWADGRVPALDD